MVRLPPAARPLYPYLKPAYTRVTGAIAPAGRLLSRVAGGHLPTASVDTLEQAASDSGGRSVIARPAETIRRSLPPGVPAGTEPFAAELTETLPPVRVAELPGARVLGPHRAVITGTGALVHELSYYFGTTRADEHPLFLRPFPGPPLHVPGRLGVLATRGDVNYYHFLMDVLPRLAVMAAVPEIEAPQQWYVPASSRFQRELLDRFAIPADRRIDSARFPHVQADCLVVPAPPSMTVVNPPWVVAWLRSQLLTGAEQAVPSRGVFVTRGRSVNNRNITNEDEVIGRLTARGFVTVDPGQMSVADQIRTFAEASCVVAPHGAALANLIFMSPGSTVVELFPVGHVLPDYWKLAGGVAGLTYRYLPGTAGGRARSRAQVLVTDLTVDLTALERLLDDVDGGGARSR